jgi:lysozyme
MNYKEIVTNNSSVIDLIKTHEGLRLNVYQCTAGKNTIGYGRNLDDNGISKDEADFMLRNDVKETTVMNAIKEKSKNQTELIDNLRYALKNWKE